MAALYVIYRTSGSKIYLADGRLYFILSHLIYGMAFSGFYYFGFDPVWTSFSEYATEDNMRRGLLLYSAAMLSFSVFFLASPVKESLLGGGRTINYGRKIFAVIPIALLGLFITGFLWHIVGSGLPLFDFEMNRIVKLQYLDPLLTFYLRIFIISMLYSMVLYWPHLRSESRWAVATLFLFYLAVQALLGNRREVLYVGLFFVLARAFQRRLLLNSRFIAIVVAIFISFAAIGTLRENQYQLMPDTIDLAPKQSEFSSNFQSLLYVVSNIGSSMEPKYGETYLRVFSFFIPRYFWSDKPISLANEFGADHGGAQIGLSLVAESVWNFGYLGPLIAYAFFAAFLFWAYKYLRNPKTAYLYFIIFTQVSINANRGDFSSIAAEILLACLCVSAFKRLFI